MQGTHRVSFALRNGPIPHGMLVLHKCDNPPCCNPEHLFLGNTRENAWDMISKGRGRHVLRIGSNHGRAVLTEAHIPEIRTAVAAGASYSDLARKYGVNRATLWYAATGRTWRHVA